VTGRGWVRVVDRVVPPALHRRLGRAVVGGSYRPPVGMVDFGSLRRLTPISRDFGFDRGLPVDRFYVEQFLSRRRNDIRGRVLEIGGDEYTRRFGGASVTHRDVLHLHAGGPHSTIVADLTDADHIPSEAFDCLLLTQTLQLLYDVRAGLQTAYRILRPGGVLLATFPGISQRSSDEWSAYWCWGFTSLSANRLFHEAFPPRGVAVESFGNVLAATAFLHGIASEELEPEELAARDPSYEVLITVRAAKPMVADEVGGTP
jgi:SAM-dependent methyltransferase